MVEFMQKILANNHAEVAPPLQNNEECWYLPLFGVYHPKKPDQIRGVGYLTKSQCRNGRRRTISEDVNSHPVFNKVLFWVVISIPQESKLIAMVFLHYEAMEHMLKFEEGSSPPQNLMEYH
jgi:hypothetical protein